MTGENMPDTTLIELTAGIVESYVSNNQIQPDQLPSLIGNIHDKLNELHHGGPQTEGSLPEPPVKPANSVRKNEVVCLECGKGFKTLKRHLRSSHGMSESEYKKRWSLPADMKLVSKSYSETRSGMAKQIGLGQRGKL